jgi:hypothetical protein
MLVTLAALGSAPASSLGQRFGAASRVASAPVMGLCLGTCVFTTLIWFTAASNTYWLIPVLGVLSSAYALRRSLAAVAGRDAIPVRARLGALCRSLGWFDALALVVICVVVAAPLSYTLHERHSVGPTGVQIWDADDYTADADAMLQLSLREAAEQQPLRANFIRLIWAGSARGDQNLDAVPLSANVNGLLGLHATDTQGLYLIVFLVAGALGAFAAVRYFAPRPRWAAILAGLLFAGPFFLQLMADGSQAAICGLGLILPIAAVGLDALRRPKLATLAILALLASGLMAIYPLFMPGLGFACAFVLMVALGASWWKGQLTGRALGRATGRIGFVLGLIVVFDVVSFSRDVRYWRGVLNGAYYTAGIPYHLPYSVLPGWLLQTREFYNLSELGSASAKQVLLGVILPGILIAVMVAGLKRRRIGMTLVPAIVIFAAMAEYVSSAHGCSYCTDRTLLPIAPLSIGLLTLGIAALATAPTHWARLAGVVTAAVVLIAVGQRTRVERLRVSDTGYFLNDANAALLAHLPPHAGVVEIEGYGENPSGAAPGELPLVYIAASERNREDVSVPTEYDDNNALAYFNGPNPANPQFDPAYRFVLTRVGGVRTGRRVVARTGPLALEERTMPLDATVVSGLAVPQDRLDAQGLAWVAGPLHLIVAGGGSGPAWISLHFRTVVAVTVPRQPGVTVRMAPRSVTACVRATGTAPLRRGTIQLNAPLLPGVVPHEPFAVAEPPQGVQLVAMRAVEHCSL